MSLALKNYVLEIQKLLRVLGDLLVQFRVEPLKLIHVNHAHNLIQCQLLILWSRSYLLNRLVLWLS